MKRICFASPNYFRSTVGGTEVQTYLMAAGIAGDGRYDVSYATTDVDEPEAVDGVRVVRIPAGNGEGGCTFEAFARTLDSESPDLVVQAGRSQFTCHAARYCSDRGIPFIFRVSSEISCRRFREVPRVFGEYTLRKAINPVRMARALLVDWRTFKAMRKASVIIAQTRTQQERLQQSFDQHVVHFRNLHEVPPEQTITKDERPMVLWLASVKSGKRPELFLDICKRLQGRGCRIVMAGRMSEERFREDIEDLATRGFLEYVENVSFEDSNALLARARVFVLTSKYEGLPNTVIQAWLRRTPTVTLGVDPDGMIAHKGLGASVATVDGAVDAIAELLEDEAKYEQAAGRAREFAIEHFGMPSQVETLKAIVDKTLHGG